MRILGARIFSKFFGGKINHIWTDVTYRGFLKIWRMRIFERENLTILHSTKGMKIFRKWRSVFFGRKINIVQKTWNFALKLKAFVFRNLACWVILYL